ncbi:MAG: SDR family NAD(P)-dependent oxidoreductase, partial [Actinomycetota bacterium]
MSDPTTERPDHPGHTTPADRTASTGSTASTGEPAGRRGAALVTGATSGLGYETARQLAAAGHQPVFVTGRTPERAAEAATTLAQATGAAVFRPVALDLGDPAHVAAAAHALAAAEEPLRTVVLNAGRVGGPTLERTAVDEEITFASSLTGHHRLTMALLAAGALAPSARLVIAGSEAARGDVPTFSPVEPAAVADQFDGDLVAAADALIRHRTPDRYKPGNVYATAKLFVAWWAAALARRLPAGMTVNAVSPGSAPDTAAVRHANFFMRHVMLP